MGKALLRAAGRLLRPALRFNHDLMMRAGEKGLRRALRRAMMGAVGNDPSAIIVAVVVILLLALVLRWVFRPSRPRQGVRPGRRRRLGRTSAC